MSSQKFAVPFRVSLKGSILLGGSLLLMYGGAIVWVVAAELPVILKIIIFIAAMIGLVLHLRQHVLKKGKRAVAGMVWDGSEQWNIKTPAGQNISAKLLGSSFIHHWLIVLNFKPESGGRMWPVIILPDSIDSTSFRRLCAKLRRMPESQTA